MVSDLPLKAYQRALEPKRLTRKRLSRRKRRPNNLSFNPAKLKKLGRKPLLWRACVIFAGLPRGRKPGVSL